MQKLLYLMVFSVLSIGLFSFNLSAEETNQEPYKKHNFSFSINQGISLVNPSFNLNSPGVDNFLEFLPEGEIASQSKSLSTGFSLGYSYSITDKLRLGVEAIISMNSSKASKNYHFYDDTPHIDNNGNEKEFYFNLEYNYDIEHKSSATFLFNTEYDFLKYQKHSLFVIAGVGVSMHSVEARYSMNQSMSEPLFSVWSTAWTSDVKTPEMGQQICLDTAPVFEKYYEVYYVNYSNSELVNCEAALIEDYNNAITKTTVVTTIPYQIGLGYSYSFTQSVAFTTKVYYSGNNTLEFSESFDGNKLDAKFDNVNSLNITTGLVVRF